MPPSADDQIYEDFNFECQMPAAIDWLKFLVYAAALWYVSTLVIGPVVSCMIARPLWIAEMGRQLYYFNEKEEIIKKTAGPTERVKIQVDSDNAV